MSVVKKLFSATMENGVVRIVQHKGHESASVVIVATPGLPSRRYYKNTPRRAEFDALYAPTPIGAVEKLQQRIAKKIDRLYHEIAMNNAAIKACHDVVVNLLDKGGVADEVSHTGDA